MNGLRPLLETLCVRLVTDPLSPHPCDGAIRAYARGRSMPLTFGDRKIKDEAELVRIMGRELDRFRSGALPKLVEAGVLTV